MVQAERDNFSHFIPVNVQWGDMDSLGHVNNVIFFRYVESGRIAYFDAVLGNDPKVWGGQGPILAEVQCQFVRQLRYPAELEIGTRTVRIGGKSLAIESVICRKASSEIVAVSHATVVWFNYPNQASVLLPEVVRAAIRGLEKIAPQE